MSPKRPLRSRVVQLSSGVAVALLSMLVGLLILEGGVRLLAADPRAHALPNELTVLDSRLGWRLARNLKTRHKTLDFDVEYRTTDLGFRDRERIFASGTHRRRVLLFGDSQIFGWGLPAAKRFSNLLESRFPGLEVWNLGVPGYGLDQQLLSYEENPSWAAKVAMLYVSDATLLRLRFAYLFGAYKPVFEIGREGKLRRIRPSAAPGRRILYRLPAWMRLPYFLDQRLGILDERLRGGPKEGGKQWSVLHRLLLERAGELAAQRGQKLIILSHLAEKQRRGWRRLCRELGLTHIPIDLSTEVGPFALGENDPHWNGAAHRLIARQIAPALERALPIPSLLGVKLAAPRPSSAPVRK